MAVQRVASGARLFFLKVSAECKKFGRTSSREFALSLRGHFTMADRCGNQTMDDRSIFLEALEKSNEAERAAFLNEACGDDAELRRRVKILLAAHDDAGSFLEKSPEEIAATSNSQAAPPDSSSDDWMELLEPSDVPGSLGAIGPYQVVELVGRGGMGVVVRAHDPKLKRTVAIKMLTPELAAHPMSVRRFLREAQAAAAVIHDHVVTIHAINENVRPPMIVMEYIDGCSLQQKIDRSGPLDVKSILRIGMQTAAGLAAAHRQGLVHRDIKPSNILLENGVERVKLSDFGLARAVDDIALDAHRANHRHAAVHVARTGPGAARRSSHRPVQLGLRALRDVYRPVGIPGEFRSRRHAQRHSRYSQAD